eukprot:6914856-Prymnesium_polylepis.1
MERSSGVTSAIVSVSLRIIHLKYSDDSIVSDEYSTAANGTIEILRISGRRQLYKQQSRQLVSYSQSDFEAACSTLAYDVDANGLVEQTDIEMFTYYLLNRQALNESAFCPRMR